MRTFPHYDHPWLLNHSENPTTPPQHQASAGPKKISTHPPQWLRDSAPPPPPPLDDDLDEEIVRDRRRRRTVTDGGAGDVFCAREVGKDEGRLEEAVRGLEVLGVREMRGRRDLELQLRSLTDRLHDLDSTQKTLATRLETLTQDQKTLHTQTHQTLHQSLSTLSLSQSHLTSTLIDRSECKILSVVDSNTARCLTVAQEALRRVEEVARGLKEVSGRIEGRGQGSDGAVGVVAGIAGRVVNAIESGARVGMQSTERILEGVAGATLSGQREATRLVEEVGKTVTAKLEAMSTRIDVEARRIEEEILRRWETSGQRLEEAKTRVEVLEKRIGVAQAVWETRPSVSSSSKVVTVLEPGGGEGGGWSGGSIEHRLRGLEVWREGREARAASEAAMLMEAVAQVHRAVKTLREEQAIAREVLGKEIELIRKEVREEGGELRELVESAVRRCARAMVIL
ncbi:hypothetical protein HDU67_000656 [Dinochytrium kinnereticum]|nr:hypothetical protein HDU67_000656 [Dinochytrium kinnereticum]